MPKYYSYKINGYFLYFTSHCINEPMHVHASSAKNLAEAGSAKFFVKKNGDTVCTNTGNLKPTDIALIQDFIKANYLDMFNLWSQYSNQGFYNA